MVQRRRRRRRRRKRGRPRWLRGCAAGGCWPENGLDGGRPFFFFSAFFSSALFSSVSVFSVFLLLFLTVQVCYQWQGGWWQLAVALGWRWWRLCWQQPVVLPPFSPSLFSLPRLGNGVGGAAVVLLVRVEAHASSSCSRVLQQGEEGGERLTVALLQTVEKKGDQKDWGYCSSLLLWSLFSILFSPLLFLFLRPNNRYLPGFLFSFPPPFSASLAPVFIGSWGEVHHTLYKHRAWWPGHGSSAFHHGGGHGSPVARECAGLPLRIVTLTESLKGVDDLHKWRITLKRLKESTFWDMEVQMFLILRLSYDCLDDSVQQCFVYCALFDRHKIEKGVLIVFYQGEDN